MDITQRQKFMFKEHDEDQKDWLCIEYTIMEHDFKQSFLVNGQKRPAEQYYTKGEPFEQYFGSIEGDSFDVYIDHFGRVQKIVGLDKLQAKADKLFDPGELLPEFRSSKEQDDADLETQRKSISEMLDDDKMREFLDEILYIYPKTKVAVGDEWDLESLSYHTLEKVNKNHFTLLEIRGDHAKLKWEGGHKIDKEDQQTTAKGRGTLYVDLNTGFIDSSSYYGKERGYRIISLPNGLDAPKIKNYLDPGMSPSITIAVPNCK